MAAVERFALGALFICLLSAVTATNDDETGLQRIFKLRFIFNEEDTEQDPKAETSVIVIEKSDRRDPIELMSDSNMLYGSQRNYGGISYKLPDSTLTFCFIVVIFYMVYLSLRMFVKPSVETSEPPTSVDVHVLRELLLGHEFADTAIPDKLRSLYDDGDQSGVTDLSKVTLVIDATGSGTFMAEPELEEDEGQRVEKVSLEEAVSMYTPSDPPPPYSDLEVMVTHTEVRDQRSTEPGEHDA